jgi:hypothetical protein
MDEFTILTNRKRALIALAHSVVFLGIALHGFLAPRQRLTFQGSATASLALLAIYLVVSSVLGWLTGIARCARERIYFAFCTASASFGLLRLMFGDTTLPVAQYLRVTMLLCAVVLGFRIFRWHAQAAVSE